MSEEKRKGASKPLFKGGNGYLQGLAAKNKGEHNARNRNCGQKRPFDQKSLFSMGFKKGDAKIAQEPVEILYSVRELMKDVSVKEIIEKCPQVAKLYELLCEKASGYSSLIVRLLDKYFHGNTTSLWINKYAPRQFNDLFQTDFAVKIEEWIKDFYYFRKNSDFDNEFGFVDDEQKEDEFSRSLQMRMKENGWNCKALVLKGRSGVGKTTLINSIARSLGIKCFEFASDVDQLQKMKELFDGSSSEVVINFQNKKKEVENNKIIKQNNSITKFLPQTATKEPLETKQPKRMQVFKDFTLYYPPHEKTDRQGIEESYLRFLFDSINKSPIPYVLTTNNFELKFKDKTLSEKIHKFDQIEFTENSITDLSRLYWAIFQIEINLNLNPSQKIRKGGLFEELNRRFEMINVGLEDNYDMIEMLVREANRKPLYISNCLQFCVFNCYKSVQGAERSEEKCRQLFEKAIRKVKHEILVNVDCHNLLNNILWPSPPPPQDLPMTAPDEPSPCSSPLPHNESENLKENSKENSKYFLREMKRDIEMRAWGDRKVYEDLYYYWREEEIKGDLLQDLSVYILGYFEKSSYPSQKMYCSKYTGEKEGIECEGERFAPFAAFLHSEKIHQSPKKIIKKTRIFEQIVEYPRVIIYAEIHEICFLVMVTLDKLFENIDNILIYIIIMSTTQVPSSYPQKIPILQFNQIKGVKTGSLERSQWNKEATEFVYEDQIAEETSHNVYKIAVVDPKTGKIIEWKDVTMMQVKSTLKGQNATGETTQQAWSINYKKKLAEEFGTSKSKRKINQMLSNNINA